MSGIDWDDAFSNTAYIPDGLSYPAKWGAAARIFRESHKAAELDVPYGSHLRQRLDLFWPDATPKGLAVFIHGGYWLDFDKSFWSHLAAGACTQGWAVAVPSYVLAPEARIGGITRAIGVAISIAAQKVDGPIHLVGHSAGGHLVSRMACVTAPINTEVAARVQRIVSISGLHDLRPLMHTRMNERLGLDAEEASAESARLQIPRAHVSVTCWVGVQERPEFLRQSRILEEAWKDYVLDIHCVFDLGRHHFDVIAPLADPDSLLTHAFVGNS